MEKRFELFNLNIEISDNIKDLMWRVKESKSKIMREDFKFFRENSSTLTSILKLKRKRVDNK